MNTQSQESAILSYLKSGRSLTPLEALDKFGSFRLGARIWNLKKQGNQIKAERVSKGGKVFARYSI